MIIYTDKISTIYYDKDNQNITYLENGLAKQELLMEQLKIVLEFSKTNKVSSVIADFRKMYGSFQNLFKFLDEVYYPTLKSRGLKCKAFILSEDIINKHLTNKLLIGLSKLGISAAIFSDTESAVKWVEQHNKLINSACTKRGGLNY